MRGWTRLLAHSLAWLALGVAFAAGWTWHYDTWPGEQPEEVRDLNRAAWSDDWQDLALPDDLPDAFDFWEVHAAITRSGTARIRIDWPTMHELFGREHARSVIGYPFFEPMPLAGRRLGDVMGDAAKRADWPDTIGFAWEAGGVEKAPRLVLSTGTYGERLHIGYVTFDRLQRRWWSPRAHWWWRRDPASRAMQRRIAASWAAVGGTAPPIPDGWIVSAYSADTLAQRLDDLGVSTANGPFGATRAATPAMQLYGWSLRGTPEQLIASERVVWRMEVENFAIDLGLGATLGVLVGGIVWIVRRLWHRLFRARRRRKAGLCEACAYDLRGSSDRCPECGKFVPTPTPAAAG